MTNEQPDVFLSQKGIEAIEQFDSLEDLPKDPQREAASSSFPNDRSLPSKKDNQSLIAADGDPVFPPGEKDSMFLAELVAHATSDTSGSHELLTTTPQDAQKVSFSIKDEDQPLGEAR